VSRAIGGSGPVVRARGRWGFDALGFGVLVGGLLGAGCGPRVGDSAADSTSSADTDGDSESASSVGGSTGDEACVASDLAEPFCYQAIPIPEISGAWALLTAFDHTGAGDWAFVVRHQMQGDAGDGRSGRMSVLRLGAAARDVEILVGDLHEVEESPHTLLAANIDDDPEDEVLALSGGTRLHEYDFDGRQLVRRDSHDFLFRRAGPIDIEGRGRTALLVWEPGVVVVYVRTDGGWEPTEARFPQPWQGDSDFEMATGDLDGDGRMDAVIGGGAFFEDVPEYDPSAQRLLVLRNAPDVAVTFEASDIPAGGRWATGLALADANGDGILDVFLTAKDDPACPSGPGWVVHLGRGDATFDPPQLRCLGADTLAVNGNAGDLDGDGTAEFIARLPDSILEAHTLLTTSAHRVGSGSIWSPMTDLDGDGRPEFVITLVNSGSREWRLMASK
jgi:hypothetical protein